MESEMNPNFVGTFEYKIKDSKTGEVLETFKDKNIVLNEGKKLVLHGFTMPQRNHAVSQISVGKDYGNPVGGWTVDNPEPPAATYSYADLDLVYDIANALTVTAPSDTVVQFNVTLVGADCLAQFDGGGHASVDVTSAALHFNNRGEGNPTVFAYKRFKKITITDLVDIDITWTITYV